MKISRRVKAELLDWLKALVAACTLWTIIISMLAVSTYVRNWHISERKACTVVAATEQDNK